MKLLNIALKDLLQLVRDWKTVVFLILMPVLFTVFFILAFQDGYSEHKLPEKNFSIGILNNSNESAVSGLLSQYLDERETLSVKFLERNSPLSIRNQLEEGTLDLIVLLASDFRFENSLQGISLIVDETVDSGKTAINIVNTALKQVENSLKIARISTDYYTEKDPSATDEETEAYFREALVLAEKGWERKKIEIELIDVGSSAGEGVRKSELTAPTQTSPGMIVQFAVFGLITSAMIIVLERKSGAFDRILTTPVTKATVVGGHTTATFLTVCIQEMILVLFGYLVYDVPYFSSPPALLLMIVSIAFWASGMGLFIGAVSKQEEQVVVISLIFMFVLCVFGGAWFPLELAGPAFIAAGKFFPSAWAMTGLQNIIVRGLGLSSVLFPAFILLVYGVFFFGLAVWRFK